MTFLRLCSRAPRTVMTGPVAAADLREAMGFGGYRATGREAGGSWSTDVTLADRSSSDEQVYEPRRSRGDRSGRYDRRRMTGSDGSLRKVIGLGLAVAVLLGRRRRRWIDAAGHQTDATAGDAFPYALDGRASSRSRSSASCCWRSELARPGLLRLRPLELLAIAFIAAAIGALVGTAFTPDPTSADDVSPLDDEAIEEREQQSGTFEEGTRAGTVDRDGDGRPDIDTNGDLIIAYDTDGDGRIDGYLQPCPDSTPAPEPRPGFTPIDNDCDGTIDEWLPFDPDTILQRRQRLLRARPTLHDRTRGARAARRRREP